MVTRSGTRQPARPTRRLAAERRAVCAVFFVFGAQAGTLSSRLPWIAARLHLSSGMLGVCVGLMMSIGALTTIPFAARLVHGFGPRASSRVLIAASGGALALPPFAPDAIALAAIMLLTGAVYGTCDNAINAQGVEAEKRFGRSVMSGFHGMWSLGALAGALGGSLAARIGVGPRVQFTVAAAVIAVAGVTATCWFDRTPRDAADAGIAAPRFVWPRGIILLIGLVGFAAIFVEVAGTDWSAVFMRWELHASQALAALGTGFFTGSMAAGRLTGDAVVRRVGATASVRVCGVLGTAGCLLVAVSPGIWVALAGFLLIGVGVSVVIPLVFAAAGHSGQSPALSVAGVATISYGAGLAGPSMIGGIAEVSSLRVAFATAALVAVAIAVGAGLLDRHPAARAAQSEEEQLDRGDDADQHHEDPQRERRQPAAVPRPDQPA
jgi:MFS family permease